MAPTVKTKIIVNGKEYHSLDELPPDLRALYDKAMASGPDHEHVQRFVITGNNVDSLDVPDEMRQMIAETMGDPKQTTSPIVIVAVILAVAVLIALAFLN
jgi:hypothetical protein